jgi:hypothetical protein
MLNRFYTTTTSGTTEATGGLVTLDQLKSRRLFKGMDDDVRDRYLADLQMRILEVRRKRRALQRDFEAKTNEPTDIQ